MVEKLRQNSDLERGDVVGASDRRSTALLHRLDALDKQVRSEIAQGRERLDQYDGPLLSMWSEVRDKVATLLEDGTKESVDVFAGPDFKNFPNTNEVSPRFEEFRDILLKLGLEATMKRLRSLQHEYLYSVHIRRIPKPVATIDATEGLPN